MCCNDEEYGHENTNHNLWFRMVRKKDSVEDPPQQVPKPSFDLGRPTRALPAGPPRAWAWLPAPLRPEGSVRLRQQATSAGSTVVGVVVVVVAAAVIAALVVIVLEL